MRRLNSKIILHGALFFIACVLTFNGCASLATSRAQVQNVPPPTAQQTPAPPKDELKIERPTSEPYTGDLSIFEDPKREKNLQIDRVMDILGITEGSNVADIGAGGGWFTVRAARRAGDKGTVYAVEINKDYLNYIEARAKRENLSNIRTVLGAEDDPKLPPASVDAVLILKTYHEIAQPVRVLAHTREAMRPNAFLGIIDRNGNGTDHGIKRETVIKEAERAGFMLYGEYDFVKPAGMDYFLVFRAKN